MNEHDSRNIVITGFMGTGKTAVAKACARMLGRKFVDMDQSIEEQFEMPVQEIFATHTEGAFRNAESELCIELSKKSNLVISTGGGALLNAANRKALTSDASAFCLLARPNTIFKRVKYSQKRPLLKDPENLLEEIRQLLFERRAGYNQYLHKICTDDREIGDIAREILYISARDGRFLTPRSIMVNPPNDGPYPICIRNKSLSDLGEGLRWLAIAKGPVAIVTSEPIWQHYEKLVKGSLEDAGYDLKPIFVPPSEEHKNLQSVSRIYDELLANDFARENPIVAFGGGVIGDLAGFVAATYLRGVKFVQVPTTLLSMVDASVGGKTGYDLSQGKNLIGAFKNPSAVFIDGEVLKTLPKDEFRAGLAEVLKHGIIGDAQLFEMLASGQLDDMEEIIFRSVFVKANIVQEDPFEEDRRAHLNLGHTFGHALELLSNYKMRHGEAVAIGLVAAAELSKCLSLCEGQLPNRIRAALAKLNLPTRSGSFSADEIYDAMHHDKKRKNGRLRFVVPQDIGDVITINAPAKQQVIQAILATKS